MPRKRRFQKKTLTKRTAYKRSVDSHLKAFADIDHQLKNACHTLESHAKPNVNMYTFARDSQKVMLLMAELRYLINACKVAQNYHKNKSTGKNKHKNINKKRRKRAA